VIYGKRNAQKTFIEEMMTRKGLYKLLDMKIMEELIRS